VKKLVLVVVILAFTSVPGLAQAGGAIFHGGLSRGQAPFFWRPFFYAGPVVYGYPAGLGYAYPGPYFSNEGDATPYTYGYPGPIIYGVYGYVRPTCSSQPNGMWICGSSSTIE
jgi:hypothetical protein